MKQYNILIVGHSFYPELTPRAFRTTELAKELARQGHSVKVITRANGIDYAAYSKEHNFNIETYKCSWHQSFRIGKSISSIPSRIINRILLLLFEYPAIEIMFRLSEMLMSRSNYDSIISIAVPYPVHWGIAKCLRKNINLCKVWIADCGDPYMGCNPFTNIYNKHPFYFRYIEKWFCRKANFITVPTEKAKLGYYPEFRQKIRVIPQGLRFDNIEISSEPINNGVLTFCYAGVFSKTHRDPRPFFQYLCESKKDFRFVVYTDKNSEALISQYKKQLDKRMIIKEYIPRLNLIRELSKMDFLINFDNIMETQTPSKLIDYALSTRPVLSINTVNLNKSTIDEFLNRKYTNRVVINDLEQYNIQNVAKTFIKLTEETSK